MATSDGLDNCLLQRGRSQSDPNILTESAIDLVHAAGKSLVFCCYYYYLIIMMMVWTASGEEEKGVFRYSILFLRCSGFKIAWVSIPARGRQVGPPNNGETNARFFFLER